MHEAAEVTLALSTLPSKDRRWFCEGVATVRAAFAELSDGGEIETYIERARMKAGAE